MPGKFDMNPDLDKVPCKLLVSTIKKVRPNIINTFKNMYSKF